MPMEGTLILGNNLIKGEGIKKMMKLQSHFPGLVSFNGIVLTSLSRNFFTDLRNTSRAVCKLK